VDWRHCFYYYKINFLDIMNTELMFSSKTNEWSTPQSFFDSVRLEFWEFDLDPAADETNHKAARFFTIADDWLAQSWFWKVWCNPPYWRDLRKWVEKCFTESRGGACYWSAFWFQQGQTPAIFTISYTTNQALRSVSFVGVSSSVIQRMLHRFLLCL